MGVSLGDMLDTLKAPTVIDYLSLDVEGAESDVMTHFPWDRYAFSVLTVERPKDDLRQWLNSSGYYLLRNNSLFGDTTWIHKTISDFHRIVKIWKNHPGGTL